MEAPSERDDLPRVHIVMDRPALERIPIVQPPAPFILRDHRPGDREAWLSIHVLADRYNTITPDLYDEQFGTDEAKLRARQLFLCGGDGRPIGTATAWSNDDYVEPDYGRVHWVAIVPEYQGRGLARPLLSKCLQRLRALDHSGAYLTTNTVRLEAVNLYLRFGFRPAIRSAEQCDAWAMLREYVKPEFASVLDDALSRA